MDLNFDIPSDEEVEESFSADCFGEPAAPTKARSPYSPSAPNPVPDISTSLYKFACFLSTLGFEPGMYVMSFLDLILNEYPIFYLLTFNPNYVPCAALPELTWLLGYEALVEQLRS